MARQARTHASLRCSGGAPDSREVCGRAPPPSGVRKGGRNPKRAQGLLPAPARDWKGRAPLQLPKQTQPLSASTANQKQAKTPRPRHGGRVRPMGASRAVKAAGERAAGRARAAAASGNLRAAGGPQPPAPPGGAAARSGAEPAPDAPLGVRFCRHGAVVASRALERRGGARLGRRTREQSIIAARRPRLVRGAAAGGGCAHAAIVPHAAAGGGGLRGETAHLGGSGARSEP